MNTKNRFFWNLIKLPLQIIVVACLFIPTNIQASHIELDLYGLSYHLAGEGYSDAPRGLDDKGAWVFSPGLGITYDFRKQIDQTGMSPMLTTGFFQDCDDRTFFFLGGGGRYRHKLSENWLLDLNYGLIFAYAQDWGTSTYYGTMLPIGNIGISRRIGGRWWTCRVTIAPENTGITATSGGSLLFANISVEL